MDFENIKTITRIHMSVVQKGYDIIRRPVCEELNDININKSRWIFISP